MKFPFINWITIILIKLCMIPRSITMHLNRVYLYMKCYFNSILDIFWKYPSFMVCNDDYSLKGTIRDDLRLNLGLFIYMITHLKSELT